MNIQLIDKSTVPIVEISAPQILERTYQRNLGTSNVKETTYKFYQIVTGVGFDGQQADWLILHDKRARILKCEITFPDTKTDRYYYECVTDDEYPLQQ
jgi:hypothetical protein